MSRIDGPSRADISRRGDAFTDVMVSAIWHTLDSVSRKFTGTVTLDDLAPIHATWKTYVSGLREHIGQTYLDSAMQTRVRQRDALVSVLHARGATVVTASLTADVTGQQDFEIPLVVNQRAEDVMAAAENRLTNVGNEVWEQARGQLLTGLQNGEGVPQLRDRVSAATDLATSRAEVIARTEISTAMNAGSLDQMRQIQMPGMTKEWIGTDDGRERPDHVEANGEKVPLDDVFSNGLEPGEDYNCRCTYGFDIPDDEQFATDTCGCDNPGVTELLASLHTFADRTAAQEEAYQRKLAKGVEFRKQQRLEREAARADGEIVPTPEPTTPPPAPVTQPLTIQNVAQILERDESLMSPCACDITANDTSETLVPGEESVARQIAITGDDALAQVKHFGELSSKLDNVLRNYQDGLDPAGREWYQTYSSWLRNKGGDLDVIAKDAPKYVVKNIKLLDEAISSSKLKENVQVYKGIANGSRSFGDTWKAEGDMTGTTWTNHAYSSTSVDRAVARNFTDAQWDPYGALPGTETPTMLRISVPKGEYAYSLTDPARAAESLINIQKEILLPRETTYRVLADRGIVDGVRLLDVEVVVPGSVGPAFAADAEYQLTLKQALAKIANAPVPTDAAIKKAQIELQNAREGIGRAGGEARGGSAADRRKQRQNLFKEFGGDDKGYVVCHGCGMKMHWDDPGSAANPHGYARFERGKIFVKCQGGGYQLQNLLPECFSCNRSRNDKMIRNENAC